MSWHRVRLGMWPAMGLAAFMATALAAEPRDAGARARLRSKIEQVYDDAYKTATGEGKRHKEAHAAGLEALYDHAVLLTRTRPLRRELYRVLHHLSTWLSRKARP